MQPLIDAHRHRAFCGIAVDALPPRELVDAIGRGVAGGRQTIIGHHNLHGMALLDEPGVSEFYDLVDGAFVDGMSLIALGRLAGTRLRRDDRATVLDWIWPFFARAEAEGWRVVHLGSSPDVIDVARRAIDDRHPDLDLVTLDGYFDATQGNVENETVIEEVARRRPHVLLVGMGMPRQERWIAENHDRLPGCVIVTVGGILGYLGADRATPPRWVGRVGLEWLARLVSEPRRLGHRYLIEPWSLAAPLGRAIIRDRAAQARRRTPIPSGSGAIGPGPVTVLYIGGEGRSGTTLLDQLLGQVPGIFGTGELFSIWEHGVLDDDRCGCGRSFSACPFWVEVGDRAFGGWRADHADAIRALRTEFVRDRYAPWLLGPRPWRGHDGDGARLLDDLTRLYRAIAEVSGASVIVDSSKYPAYAMALSRLPGVDLKVVRIVRDVRGAAYSWTKEVSKPEVTGAEAAFMDRYPPAMTAIRWLKTEKLFDRLAGKGVPSETVRYEDLVSEPTAEVCRVLELVGMDPASVDLSWIDGTTVELAPTHTVAGNPSRFRTGAVALRLDEAWRRELPRRHRVVVTALTAGRLRAHDYSL